MRISAIRSALLWRLLHLNRSFESVYARREYQRLSQRRHATLGATPLTDGHDEFTALEQFGLRPDHVVVDFGCGSLRIGRHLIDYLQTGNYWGLDITDVFFSGAAYDGAKEPHLHVISSATLRRAHRARPDFILIEGVLQCVPPWRIERVLSQVAVLACRRTLILLSFLESDEALQLGTFAFRHSLGDVQRLAAAAGLALRVLRRGCEPLVLRGLAGAPLDRSLRGTAVLLGIAQ